MGNQVFKHGVIAVPPRCRLHMARILHKRDRFRQLLHVLDPLILEFLRRLFGQRCRLVKVEQTLAQQVNQFVYCFVVVGFLVARCEA
jgi:hypothetical protein